MSILSIRYRGEGEEGGREREREGERERERRERGGRREGKGIKQHGEKEQ